MSASKSRTLSASRTMSCTEDSFRLCFLGGVGVEYGFGKAPSIAHLLGTYKNIHKKEQLQSRTGRLGDRFTSGSGPKWTLTVLRLISC